MSKRENCIKCGREDKGQMLFMKYEDINGFQKCEFTICMICESKLWKWLSAKEKEPNQK